MGSGISRTNADSQWNPVYNAFHRSFGCGNERFVGSSVNVILTWQTCVQRSSRAAESKRRALENHFPMRICYMFPIPQCRRDWDLVRCTFLGTCEKRNDAQWRPPKKKRVSPAGKIGIWQMRQVGTGWSTCDKWDRDRGVSILCGKAWGWNWNWGVFRLGGTGWNNGQVSVELNQSTCFKWNNKAVNCFKNQKVSRKKERKS